MKIGINLLYLLPDKIGGTETYARGILSGLVKSKYEYLLYCNQENYSSLTIDRKNFKKFLINFSAKIKLIRLLAEQFLLPFYVYRHKIDVLVSFGYICPLFLPCKSIVFIYDLNWYFHPEEFSFFTRLAWKFLVSLSAKRADIIITSSINSQKDIIKILKVKPDKVSVIYGGVDMKRFKLLKSKNIVEIREKYGITKNYILTVSAYYKFKNLVSLIKSFKCLDGDFQLVIVGLGGKGKADMLKTIKDLSLEKKVLVAGWVSNEDLPILYSNANLYVHPSLYEGFGFPVLEAMASGCPVISSSSASLPELVGEAGILVNAKNIKLLSEKMQQVLSDGKMTKMLKEKGYFQSRKFTWVKASKRLLSILTKYE